MNNWLSGWVLHDNLHLLLSLSMKELWTLISIVQSYSQRSRFYLTQGAHFVDERAKVKLCDP